MKPLLLVSILLAGSLAAQEQKKPEEGKPSVQKVFLLKYADPAKIGNLLGVFGARIFPNTDLHALAVSASPEIMPAIEDAIKRLDLPAAAAQDIELTAYYVIGGDGEGTPGGPPPKELENVIVQLKNSFAFKSYRLLDMLTMRMRSNGRSADTSSNPGTLTAGLPSVVTQFHTGTVNLSPDGSTVSLVGLKAGVRIPTPTGPISSNPQVNTQYTYIDLGLNADVDIKEGQKVVVGRLSVNKDQALFLVLTARVVN